MSRRLLLLLSSCLLILAAHTTPAATPASPNTPTAPPSILFIGDSLSVGTFGSSIQGQLIARYGASNFALYASCGSSPEHWLANEPTFVTRCGFRMTTSTRSAYIDYVDGKRPPAVNTPKIEKLLAIHKPEVVIIQLGTNWLDDFAKESSTEDIRKKQAVLHNLGTALRGKRVIWILPPDSSKFSKSAQATVREIIRSSAYKERFEALIDSRRLTHYVRGKTGSDGIHYNGEDAIRWANGVMENLVYVLH
jgi:lysophospholipase L1-like esterase